eukprot:TRINITY_DN58630_c0_g1_i1.p1 TRINITY_DN58630_c0_g1~~TRINITY_DN58630_c0_g1_i1.p1  ORF type:complete len:481 (-),score=122.55 TRINITY_DN58630_c0_g1_i1:51-1376(-)
MQNRRCRRAATAALLAAALGISRGEARTALRASLRATAGRETRSSSSSAALVVREGEGEDPADSVAKSAEIKEKWDKMDEFLKVMFTMACKWKHGKDVSGAAAEKLKNGELENDEVAGYKKKLQEQNLQGLTQACGRISASGKASCRSGCGDRWGEAAEKRADCDKKCVAVYDKFDAGCAAKAENLEKVYKMKLSAAEARNRCYEGFCPSFPTVWTQADEASMTSELTSQCASQCSEASIEVACRKKWQLEVDFKRSNITQQCFDQSKVKACFSEKKAAASAAQDTCASDGKTTCGTQHDDCMSKSQAASAPPEAKAACDERKKMCLKQVTDSCLANHRAALDAAQADCEKADTAEAKQCESDALTDAMTKDMETCKTQKTSSCPKDCAAKCGVEKLSTCLTNLKSEHDPAKDFCEDLWGLLHGSSEVDPVTGNPIVLLAS